MNRVELNEIMMTQVNGGDANDDAVEFFNRDFMEYKEPKKTSKYQTNAPEKYVGGLILSAIEMPGKIISSIGDTIASWF